MSYIVSARKYRPKTFEDVVGQEQITNTLKKAIESDHLAQAFLFCGPRGVGKTTCARILAKAVNTGKTEKLGEIDEDFAFNIFELDAASNNGVDNMHQLTAQVRIPPQTGKYKIYIIDEVHMLSTAAFNAFLKTLEEPPPYAIFILATTEKHKILPTILSRCQIYDFRRISVNDIVAHLKSIANLENITAADDALHIIAEKADGALRDALSIFDRLISFSGDNLTYEAVVKNLNVLDYDYFFKIVEALTTEDISNALLIYNEILNNGFEGNHFSNGLADHLRNLLVCKDERTLQLLEVSDSLKSKYQNQATITPKNFLINSLSLLSDADVQYAQSQNKRLLIELTLLKIAYAAQMLSSENVGGGEKKKILVNKSVETGREKQVKRLEHKDKKPETKNEKVSTEQLEVQTSPESERVKEFSEKGELTAESKETTELTIENEVAEPEKQLSTFDSLDAYAAKFTEKPVEEKTTKDGEVQEGDTKLKLNRLELSKENLLKTWQKMLEKFKDKDELKSLYEKINDKQPVLKEDVLEITLDSELEQNRFLDKNMSQTILSYLKSEIEVDDLSIELILEQRENVKKHVLNEKEKYELLLKQNPLLKDFKDQLGLEFEL